MDEASRRAYVSHGTRVDVLDADAPPGRSEKLIPLVRETFGDAMTLYADANSSYDVPKAIAIGRLMEKYKYGFFEEPVPFDHLDETKQVADALTIQVAGGEQEFSLWGFRRMIHHRAVSIVQPDLHYFGGFVRCLRVARMAAEAGLPCTLHLGGGLGYVDALHFMSCIPNPLAHQECKGQSNVPVHCETSSLKPKDGPVRAGLRLRAQSRLRPQSGAGEGRLKRVSGALVWFGT